MPSMEYLPNRQGVIHDLMLAAITMNVTVSRPFAFLLGICRAGITTPRGLFLFKHLEGNSRRSCRYATIHCRSDRNEGIEFMVGQSNTTGFFNPVSSANLTATSHCHGEAN